MIVKQQHIEIETAWVMIMNIESRLRLHANSTWSYFLRYVNSGLSVRN